MYNGSFRFWIIHNERTLSVSSPIEIVVFNKQTGIIPHFLSQFMG